MSDPEKFLTRWSRRKRDVADAAVEPRAAPEAGKPAVQSEEANQLVTARAPAANAPPAAEFDLTKLPSLDSIGANSDIRVFLQAGVPSALKHAALRRAWAADPAIRDFKGLAENDWDFTAPDSMRGFGELGPQDDIKKLLAEVFGEAKPNVASQVEPPASAPSLTQPVRLADKSDPTVGVAATSEPPKVEQQQLAALDSDAMLRREETIATQQDDAKEEPAAMLVRRHGSAMPQ
jgi:hypothetical protein